MRPAWEEGGEDKGWVAMDRRESRRDERIRDGKRIEPLDPPRSNGLET